MTRARTASYGLGNPPPLDHWIDAVLMLFAILVQGVAATFGMCRCGGERDWHTHSDAPALPQTKPDIQDQDPDTLTDPSIRLPRDLSPEARRAQGEGGDPVSARSALPTRAHLSTVIQAEARKRIELETRSHAHKCQHVQPLASGSRKRASGMTPFVNANSA